MAKHKRLGLTALFLSFCLSGVAFAKTAIFPAETSNLSRDEQVAIWSLFSTAYRAEGGDDLLPLSESLAAHESAGGTNQAVETLGVSEYLLVGAVRLDKKIAVTASRHRADGSVVHSARLTAASLDDIEPVVDRLAKSMFSLTSPSETRSLDNVTETEAHAPNRTYSQKVRGFKVGWAYNQGYAVDINPNLIVGFDGKYEGKHHFIELGFGLILPARINDGSRNVGGIYGDLGASYYLTRTSTSPFIGGGIMPRLVGPSVVNAAVYGQAGLMFLRESTTRIYIDGRVAQNIIPMDFGGDLEDDRVYPTEFILEVGLGW